MSSRRGRLSAVSGPSAPIYSGSVPLSAAAAFAYAGPVLAIRERPTVPVVLWMRVLRKSPVVPSAPTARGGHAGQFQLRQLFHEHMWHYQIPCFSGSGVGHGCFHAPGGSPATDAGRCPAERGHGFIYFRRFNLSLLASWQLPLVRSTDTHGSGPVAPDTDNRSAPNAPFLLGDR